MSKSEPSYREESEDKKETTTKISTSVIDKPKLWRQSKAAEVVAYFKEKWEEEEVIEDEDFQDALKKLKKIAGKCFNNNIIFFNLVNVGEQLFSFGSKSSLKDNLVSEANINALVASNIALKLFKEAGLYFNFIILFYNINVYIF